MTDATVDTSTADAEPDGPPACVSWSAPNIGDPCSMPMPEVDVILDVQGGWSADTDNGLIRKGNDSYTPTSMVMTLPGTTVDVRVFILPRLIVPSNANLDVTGTKAAIFVVHGDVTLDGDMSASASFTVSGPGAPAGACNAAPGTAPTGNAGGGAGGGGAHADLGGKGATGADDGLGSTPGTGGGGGTAFGVATLEPLIAGCRGRNGVGPGGLTAAGGGGGGAFEITARGAMVINSIVSSNGGGGNGGQIQRGGGGGGSGGAILLDAATIAISASGRVVANGGGGGGGGNTASAGAGGQPGSISATRALGGNGVAPAGDGGRGGAGALLIGDDGLVPTPVSASAGGGGGGSVGRLVIRGRSSETIDASAIVSPAAN
jgi:hypothetical protein